MEPPGAEDDDQEQTEPVMWPGCVTTGDLRDLDDSKLILNYSEWPLARGRRRMGSGGGGTLLSCDALRGKKYFTATK